MGSAKTELREWCRRLRLENRHSYLEIHEITGASKGSLSLWLADIPLTEKEKSLRIRSKKGTNLKSRGEESRLHQRYSFVGKSRSWKGKVAESAVLLRLVLEGFKPFGSPFDGDTTDWLVIRDDGKIIRIEVRWAGHYGSGLPTVNLMRSEGRSGKARYSEDDFDVLAAYDLFSDTVFVYTAEEIKAKKRSIKVSFDHAEAWHKLRG